MKLRINIIYKKITTCRLLLFCLAGFVTAGVQAADKVAACELSVYGEDKQQILSQDDVIEMVWDSQRHPDGVWRFELTEKAGDKFTEYTSSRVGQSLSLYCGEEPITQITIMAPLHSSFTLTGLDKNLVPYYGGGTD